MGFGKRVQFIALCAALLILLPFAVNGELKKEQTDMAVSSGKKVSIEYTLSFKNSKGNLQSAGPKLLSYIHGKGHLISGLEKALEGMKTGESKKVTVKAEDGYGFFRQDRLREIDITQVANQGKLEVGAIIRGEDKNGKVIRARVSEIKGNTVLLDFNHPLAGKTLFYDVKVLDIKDAGPEK